MNEIEGKNRDEVLEFGKVMLILCPTKYRRFSSFLHFPEFFIVSW